MTKQEGLWRKELEKLGPRVVRDAIYIRHDRLPVPEEFSVQWLSEKEIEAKKRERASYSYLKSTFVAAVAAAAGLLGIVLTWHSSR